jgi:hypothetical protein
MKLSDWIQILTAIAVLAGMGLVIYELRQTKELALADLLLQGYAFANEVDNTLIGENAAESLTKDCLGEQLTPQDVIVLDEYFSAMFDKANAYRDVMGFAREDDDWQFNTRENLAHIFSTERGRIWWEVETARWYVEPEVLEIGNQLLSELGPPQCADWVRKYLGSNP